MAIAAPVPIGKHHDVSAFDCSHADLVDWLKRRAMSNERTQASRTYVACDAERVVGYYALAAGSLELRLAPGSVRRNMPAPIPAVVLARLAVDTQYQGLGLGAGLLQDAVLRSINAAQAIGARVMLCHAIDDQALAFYQHHGFRPSPAARLMVMLDLSKVPQHVTDRQ
ncbi:MAG TPA: GNAT family N-acetyltransferase [Oleiagrimonas sp.]|nr:GNAT family N-acetyltransferase [Oleiagrimonas sp.]